MTSSLSVA